MSFHLAHDCPLDLETNIPIAFSPGISSIQNTATWSLSVPLFYNATNFIQDCTTFDQLFAVATVNISESTLLDQFPFESPLHSSQVIVFDSELTVVNSTMHLGQLIPSLSKYLLDNGYIQSVGSSRFLSDSSSSSLLEVKMSTAFRVDTLPSSNAKLVVNGSSTTLSGPGDSLGTILSRNCPYGYGPSVSADSFVIYQLPTSNIFVAYVQNPVTSGYQCVPIVSQSQNINIMDTCASKSFDPSLKSLDSSSAISTWDLPFSPIPSNSYFVANGQVHQPNILIISGTWTPYFLGFDSSKNPVCVGSTFFQSKEFEIVRVSNPCVIQPSEVASAILLIVAPFLFSWVAIVFFAKRRYSKLQRYDALNREKFLIAHKIQSTVMPSASQKPLQSKKLAKKQQSAGRQSIESQMTFSQFSTAADWLRHWRRLQISFNSTVETSISTLSTELVGLESQISTFSKPQDSSSRIALAGRLLNDLNRIREIGKLFSNMFLYEAPGALFYFKAEKQNLLQYARDGNNLNEYLSPSANFQSAKFVNDYFQLVFDDLITVISNFCSDIITKANEEILDQTFVFTNNDSDNSDSAVPPTNFQKAFLELCQVASTQYSSTFSLLMTLTSLMKQQLYDRLSNIELFIRLEEFKEPSPPNPVDEDDGDVSPPAVPQKVQLSVNQ